MYDQTAHSPSRLNPSAMNHLSDPPSLPLDEQDLERMLSALVDGILSQEDRARLEDRLMAEAAARRRYLEFMQTEFLLASEIGFGEAAQRTQDCPQESVNASCVRQGVARWAWPFIGAAAATVVGFAVWQWSGKGLGPDMWLGGPVHAPAAARITAEHDATWEAEWLPEMGQPLAPGLVRLLRGSAQVTFASGAVVSIHAPTAMEVLGANRMFLRSGRITPFVPPSAKGFTVVSPSGEVVDFGTEFTVGVGADGKTDVFVIGGEVGVTGGHGESHQPVQFTQGYATQFSLAEQRPPAVTLRPLVVEHFDLSNGPLRRRDFDPGLASRVHEGHLWLPIDGRPHRRVPIGRTVLENDFTAIVGRRSVVSFKASLPNVGTAFQGRWVGLVIDDGEGEPQEPHHAGVALALLMSPLWEAGLVVNGMHHAAPRFFARNEDRVGPYQAVVTIDDSPAAHEAHGSGVVTVMINGLEVVRETPLRLPARPRFTLETYVRPREGGAGYALVDDFSVSLDVPAEDPSLLGL